MIGGLFGLLLAGLVALAGVAAYYRSEAANVPKLEHALDLSLQAIESQEKAIAAQSRLREIQDGLYAEAAAEREESQRILANYRKQQREDAKKDPAVAQWGATRIPDAVIDRLSRHDARYHEQAGAGGAAAVDDRANSGAQASHTRRNER